VSFLNSGGFLKPILTKSQCWCVDDATTFVLRGRDDSFYRIELPGSTAEGKESIEHFKRTLDQLLRYEKTPCPFRKGYADLLEHPTTPARQKSILRHSPAKKWRLNKFWEPEDAELRAEFLRRRTDSNESAARPVTPLQGFSVTKDSPLRYNVVADSELRLNDASNEEVVIEDECVTGATWDNSDLSSKHDQQSNSLSSTSSDEVEPVESAVSELSTEEALTSSANDANPIDGPLVHPLRQHPIPNQLRVVRSATAPPYLTMTMSPPSTSDSLKVHADEVETASISSSRDSFYSLEEDNYEIVQDKPAVTTNGNSERLTTIYVPSHSRNSSGTSSSIPDTPRAFGYINHSLPSPIIASDNSSTENIITEKTVTTPQTTIRLRRPIRELESNPTQQASDTLAKLTPSLPMPVKPIGVELIRKTCTILMAPPAHLISLMLHIAEILVHRMPSHVTRHIPGSWESSDIDEDSSDDVWNEFSEDEDDFGYPLTRRGIELQSQTSVAESLPGKNLGTDNWEID
jgi:Inheritance of peroxisomes protein 1